MWAWLIGWAWATEPGGAVAAAEVREVVEVPIHLRQPAFPLSMAARDVVRTGRWDEAVPLLQAAARSELRPNEQVDLAFVTAWALIGADRAAEAVPLLPTLFPRAGGAGNGTTSSAPLPYLILVKSALLAADGQQELALTELSRVPEEWSGYPRVALLRADTLDDLGRAEEAIEVLRAAARRADPVAGNERVLLALATRLPAGSDEAYAALRRAWVWYGGTPEATEAATRLDAYGRPATPAERLDRGERLVEGGMNDAALTTANPLVGSLTPGSVEACRLAFIRGKALYRKNDLTGAVAAFSDAGRRCGATKQDYGAKILYLQGYAEFRRGRYAESAAAYLAIADLYPSSSMADDGLTRGGHSKWEGGDRDGALAAWARAMEGYPTGDTTPEATFRLAFARYEDGRVEDAIRTAERLGRMDGRLDPYYVPAGRYWAPRWRLYPDVADPRRADPGGRDAAVAGWASALEDWPQHYYALLSYARLREVDPATAARVAVRPSADSGFGPWEVRRTFFDDPRVGYGVALARLGLLKEAVVEWAGIDTATLEPEEMAWLQELRREAGDWLGSHKIMQQYLKTHPVGTLGPREAQIVTLSWPDRYWEDVRDLAGGYDYAPRMFHALVREESSFDKDIVSFAGARGLSQVMPATAREVARWLGMSLSDRDMFDPRVNLRLGGRYLSSVYNSMGGNPFLAMASYNGGPGRIKGWLGEWGNPPTDEYVERIPVRETRDYVKKVSTSWQVMRYAFDHQDEAYPDLSRFNHHAIP